MPKSSTNQSAEKAKKTKSKAPSRAKSSTKKHAAPSVDINLESLSPEDRYCAIQEQAYLIAEANGFQAGKELDYWLEAERELAKKPADTEPASH